MHFTGGFFMLKKLLIGGAFSLGTAFVAWVSHENCQLACEYNALAEKYNRMSDFIDKCDF